jgi:hypothetical protein
MELFKKKGAFQMMNETLLILASFLICWPLAVYLFWRWDIGGYRSEREAKQSKKK